MSTTYVGIVSRSKKNRRRTPLSANHDLFVLFQIKDEDIGPFARVQQKTASVFEKNALQHLSYNIFKVFLAYRAKHLSKKQGQHNNLQILLCVQHSKPLRLLDIARIHGEKFRISELWGLARFLRSNVRVF